MLLTNDPGPWQYYVNRPDNVGLPIMEVKDKYMREQLLFEQNLNFIQQQRMMMSNESSGGGVFNPNQNQDDTENSYVVNDYVEDYLD
jgi:hypothetical protein